MLNRSSALLEIRPEIASAVVNESSSIVERFQNKTLRPIIKLQHPLWIECFRYYLKKRKTIFFDLHAAARQIYIKQILQKDVAFRNQLLGMVIGYFTLAEYETYTEHSSKINNRIITILTERITNSFKDLKTE